MMATCGERIMGALVVLPPDHFSDLTRSLAADLTLHQRRLSFLLLHPLYFAHTLAYLRALSLGEKALLLARLLLRSLAKLLPSSTGPARRHSLRLREFDAALLLRAMCDVYDRDDDPRMASGFDWRAGISRLLVHQLLSPTGLGTHGWGALGQYVDEAVKCRRLLAAVSGGGAKAGRRVGASMAAVLSLPSVECRGGGWECAVCREEVEAGREVYGLPCGHRFHWACITRWLLKRNTCPCCRFELPTDDVFAEIERVWRSTDGVCGG